MDGDMNDIFQKLNNMLSDEETRSNLKNILGNISSSDNSSDKQILIHNLLILEILITQKTKLMVL